MSKRDAACERIDSHLHLAGVVLLCALLVTTRPSDDAPAPPIRRLTCVDDVDVAAERAKLAAELDADRLAVRNRALRVIVRSADARFIPDLVDVAQRGHTEGAERAVHILQEFAMSDDFQLADAASEGLRQASKYGRGASAATLALTQYQSRLVKRLQPRINGKGGSLSVNPNGAVQVALNSDWNGDGSDLRLLCKLQRLDRLSLERSALTDEDMVHLRNVRAVTLYLGETKISARGLRALGELPSAEYLSLRQNKLRGLSPNAFSGFPNLATLALDETDVTNEDLAAVASLTRLQTLILDRAAAVTDEGLKHLNQLPLLKQLQLRATQVTGVGVAGLNLPMLELLQVKGCPLTSEGIASICKLPTLTTLGLDHTSAGDDDMRHVATLPKLQTLWLSKSQVTDVGLQHLSKIPTLQTIYVHGAPITSDGRRNLQKILPQCRVEGVQRNSR